MSRMDADHLTLDLDRFAKLWRVAESVPHEGDNRPERDTARRLAEKMAERSGLSLAEAVARVRSGAGTSTKAGSARPPRPKPPPPRSAQEDALNAALDAAGHGDPGAFWTISQAVRRIIRSTLPWPRTIGGILSEVDAWDALEATRNRLAPDYYILNGAGAVRREMLLHDLATKRADSVAEAMARADWLAEHVTNINHIYGVDQIARAVAADVRRLAERVAILTRGQTSASTQHTNQRRSNLDKRQAVEAVLRAPGGDRLTLRKVAERAGVSPETVRAVKHALS